MPIAAVLAVEQLQRAAGQYRVPAEWRLGEYGPLPMVPCDRCVGDASSVCRVLLREKAISDRAQCLDLLLEVHQVDGYPLYLPDDVPGFITPDYEVAAWVSEHDGRVVGHVALHQASVDPTLAAAQRVTAFPADRLAVVSRLFTSPRVRRSGVGRSLLRYATEQAHRRGQRAVLDVGKTLPAAVALYESERWQRVDSLELHLVEGPRLGLWVYIGPDVNAG